MKLLLSLAFGSFSSSLSGLPLANSSNSVKSHPLTKNEKDSNPEANYSILLVEEAMVMTNFTGAGVGLGFGVGCGFGVGWGFGGMPLNFLGLGAGGGCGVGFGLGWGFGTGFGSQYRNSRVIFQGMDLDAKASDQVTESKDSSKSTQTVRASQ